jgi:hypothetical protein
MMGRLEADDQLLAAVAIAEQDGVSIDSVLARGPADLAARLALMEIRRRKHRG